MKLKILTYNTCYGLKANTLLDAYNATWRVVHKRKNPEEIREKSDFGELYRLIEKVSPDIIVLNEIFDDLQTGPVIQHLKEMGYGYTFIGRSGHHKAPLVVSTVIATKMPCTEVRPKITFPNGIPGTGGGAIGVYLEAQNTLVYGVHLAYIQDTLLAQLQDMEGFLQNDSSNYKNIILAGDFNREYNFYAKRSMVFKKFKYVKTSRTFPSFFPWYKLLTFFFKNIIAGSVDNIFYKGDITVSNAEVINKQRSDHKPVIATLEISDEVTD